MTSSWPIKRFTPQLQANVWGPVWLNKSKSMDGCTTRNTESCHTPGTYIGSQMNMHKWHRKLPGCEILKTVAWNQRDTRSNANRIKTTINTSMFDRGPKIGDNLFSLLFKSSYIHDDDFTWKHFSRYWPFVRGIHRSPVNSPHKGHWHSTDVFFDLRLNKRLSKQW